MIEQAEIFRRYGPQYRAKFGDRMPSSHLEAMWAIEHCRTETLGGHIYSCDACNEIQYSYHSCQNRHCPIRIVWRLSFCSSTTLRLSWLTFIQGSLPPRATPIP